MSHIKLFSHHKQNHIAHKRCKGVMMIESSES